MAPGSARSDIVQDNHLFPAASKFYEAVQKSFSHALWLCELPVYPFHNLIHSD